MPDNFDCYNKKLSDLKNQITTLKTKVDTEFNSNNTESKLESNFPQNVTIEKIFHLPESENLSNKRITPEDLSEAFNSFQIQDNNQDNNQDKNQDNNQDNIDDDINLNSNSNINCDNTITIEEHQIILQAEIDKQKKWFEDKINMLIKEKETRVQNELNNINDNKEVDNLKKENQSIQIENEKLKILLEKSKDILDENRSKNEEISKLKKINEDLNRENKSLKEILSKNVLQPNINEYNNNSSNLAIKSENDVII